MSRADPFRTADGLMRRSVERRSFHSAVLLVAAGGQIVCHRGYGRARLDSVFDLASLTKPLATTAALMRLCSAGLIDPTTAVSSVMPRLRGSPLAGVRVWQLLNHSSGLAAWRPFYQQLGQREPGRARGELWRRLAAEVLERRPGELSVYSDLGFMLLGRLVERVAGRRLDRVAHRLVFAPLGLTRTGFYGARGAPGAAGAGALPLVPTERHPKLGRLRGQVHDDNCRIVGGVCGHAGLFGSAYDVHLLARELVAADRGRRSLFDARVVRRFFGRPRGGGSSWALGWDTPFGVPKPSCGRWFSDRSVGHLGFTGTSLWIDLAREVWVVLLTNRVYYGREPNPMKRFRPQLHDAVMRAVVGGPGS